MAVDSVGPLAPLPRLAPLSPPQLPPGEPPPAAGGFASVLNGLLAGTQQTYAAADTAIADLATGRAQDAHTVAMAVAQADVSFRLLLEIRNRLSDAFQEISRMQV
jgi:flagellar hook-basal body complex protein FliE